MGRSKLSLCFLITVALVTTTGCLEGLEQDPGSGPIVPPDTNNTTQGNNTTTPDQGTTTPSNNTTSPPASDMGGVTTPPSMDMSPPPEEDMGQPPTPEDMGMTTPPEEDMGPPPLENPCENGPLDAPIPNCRPAPYPSTGDFAEDCVRRINQFRWECQCLPPLQRWTEGEQCADEHAAYDAANNSPHAGFSGRICSPGGFGQNECPGYGSADRAISICLQQMWDEGPGENFQMHGHYLNMTNSRFSMVACGEADGWFVQNFQ